MDIHAIRLANLRLLLDEAAKTIGRERGAAQHLARLSGVPATVISQAKNQRQRADGSARKIGDDIARRLERGGGKEKGWMDVSHEHELLSSSDMQTLNALKALSPTQRELIERQIEEFLRLSGAVLPDPQLQAKRQH